MREISMRKARKNENDSRTGTGTDEKKRESYLYKKV